MRLGCFWCLGLCCVLTACFSKVEQGKDDLSVGQPDSELLRQGLEKDKPEVKRVAVDDDTAGPDTVDHLHSSIAVHIGSGENPDTVCHYPIGRKIEVGRHYGEKLYLELGEFYDDLTYNGAKVYWGDSLVYATALEVVNDWNTCMVHHVDSTDVTYMLLMIDDRPLPSFWHILCMDGADMRLVDNVYADNDYREEESRYFHRDVIFEDLDGDGLVEVGGKHYTEYWADSMTYQPCLIYKLGRRLAFDESSSEHETRKAYDGIFLGFERIRAIYNPDERKHEKPEEE